MRKKQKPNTAPPRFLERGEISDDLAAVGPEKPVGYDNLRAMRHWRAEDIAALRENLENRGLKTLLLKEKDCAMRHGALYAYDEKALQKLLTQRADILHKNGWPSEPEEFIRKIAREWVPEKTPLFDTIADTFNNRAHPGRTDVKVPKTHHHFSKQYLDCLREREKNPQSNRRCSPP